MDDNSLYLTFIIGFLDFISNASASCKSILLGKECKIDLQLAEAFEIKSKNPIINVKYNELSSMLGLFL